MIHIPIQFPSARERLTRLIDADRELSVRERIQAVDEMRTAAQKLCNSVSVFVDHDRLRRIRQQEVRSIFREFIQRHPERAAPTD